MEEGNKDNSKELLKNAYKQFMAEYYKIVCRLWKIGVPGNLVYKPEDLMVIALFRKWNVYILSLLALYKDGQYESAIPVLRSAFECFLQIVYYLQDSDKKFEKCQCYCICQNYKRAHRFDWMLKYGGNGDFGHKDKVNEYLDKMESINEKFVSKYYEEKRQELLKKNCPGAVEWFKLYDVKISNFGKLAEAVANADGRNLRIMYDALYDVLSCGAHSKDVWDGIILEKEVGKIKVRSFDDPIFVLSYDLEVLVIMLRILSEKLTATYRGEGLDFTVSNKEFLLLTERMKSANEIIRTRVG